MRLTGALRQYAGTFENLVYKMKKLRMREGFINEPTLSEADALFAAKAGMLCNEIQFNSMYRYHMNVTFVDICHLLNTCFRF